MLAKRMSAKDKLIDVRKIMAETPVEELNRLADEYFSRLSDWNYHLAKPFGSFDEVPQLPSSFAITLQGLAICQGMTVLEFGAGTCWASRFLTQLGCQVIAVDVSPTALRIGAELYKRQPVFGDKPAPQFLIFDGHHLELPDNAVDRVMCLDALHHIPNPAEILSEIGRVLKDGGIAGFAEPGPEHSHSPMSQYEMRTFKIIENDIDVREIWRSAQLAGFTDMKLAVFNVHPLLLGLDVFEKFLKGSEPLPQWTQLTAEFLKDHQSFFLYKGETAAADSRFRTGLVARIEVGPRSITVQEGEPIQLQAAVENISTSTWLPQSAGLGAVMLGCHVYDSGGNVFKNSYHWEPLTPGEGRIIVPGERTEFPVGVPPLPRGNYILEFDMVSNDVCWFALNGSATVKVIVNVI